MAQQRGERRFQLVGSDRQKLVADLDRRLGLAVQPRIVDR
jgi:hypothetical protein